MPCEQTAETSPASACIASNCPAVAIVITTYNHAHFLADAITSAVTQTHPASEVIVVDDGSEDDPAAVAGMFDGIRFLRQRNLGLSAARNAGMAATQAEMVVFLDADDRLLPNAIAAGLACHRQNGISALVYGGHHHISREGVPFSGPIYNAIGANAHESLLVGNLIGMHATVMYRREMLAEVGGFDITVRRCEDYDVYLRLAQRFRMSSHPAVVAEYRKHGNNMSSAHLEMLSWALRVQNNAARAPRTRSIATAWRDGRANWRAYYADQILLDALSRRHRQARPSVLSSIVSALATFARIWQASPRHATRWARGEVFRVGKRMLPPSVTAWLRNAAKRALPLGAVRFGDFASLTPIDSNFGYGRGTPIDRCYIESFLEQHSADIAGRVLEIGDDSYSRRFGAGRIARQDVLHVHADHPHATIIGDLAAPDVLPSESFDCIILTQTLHLIFDMRAALAQLHKALRPGGILLLTVPGITPIDRNDWGATWYWSLTPAAASRLANEVFDPESVSVESHGNVFAAVCFLHGLALEDVPRAKLLVKDKAFPVVVTVRARKSLPAETA